MKNYTITVNGTAYNVSVEEGTSAAPAAAPVAAAPVPAPAPAAAPAPGGYEDGKRDCGAAGRHDRQH